MLKAVIGGRTIGRDIVEAKEELAGPRTMVDSSLRETHRIAFDLSIHVVIVNGMARVLAEAVNVETDRETIAASLEETHHQHCRSDVGATMETGTHSNRGYPIEVDVPIPMEAIATV